MPRGVEDEARQPILEGVSSSGAEVSSGLRARALSRDTAAPVPHGDPREVPPWGRVGSRDTAKDAYAVWCERHGAPVGVATWLVVLSAFGFASPLSRADASPATRAACAALLCASLISMALVNRLDPGIIPPSPTDDPIVETLDALLAERSAGEDRASAAASSEPATLPGGVRRDPITGHYARLVAPEPGAGRYGGNDVADVETAAEGASRRSRPLRVACELGHDAVAECLLQNGASPDAASGDDGASALHAAVRAGRDATAKLLVRRGASVTSADAKGRTALDAAMDRGSIADEELFLMLSSSGPNALGGGT